MIQVAVPEADLLTVARALVTPGAYASVDLLLAGPGRVERLGPSAMGVLQRMLARGVVKTLAQLGGAHARPRPGATGRVRVFDVRRPPVLEFGPWSFELLQWLTNAQLGAREEKRLETHPRTLGDQVLAYVALRLVAGQRLERAVAASPGLACPLTWLGFPRLLARHGTAEPSLGDLLATDDGCTIVECLELDLGRRWAEPWRDDDVFAAPLALRIGTAERVVLAELLDGLARRERWDLAQPLIRAGLRALPAGLPARELALRFSPQVLAEGTLRSRMEARRAAGALLVALERIARKREELGLVRFIDDDYEAAQTILRSWEELPREAFVRAEDALSVLLSLDPLREISDLR